MAHTVFTCPPTAPHNKGRQGWYVPRSRRTSSPVPVIEIPVRGRVDDLPARFHGRVDDGRVAAQFPPQLDDGVLTM